MEKAKSSVSAWLIMGIILLFMFISPFYRGLFNGHQSFDRPIYSALIWASIALVLLSVYMFNRWELKKYNGLFALTVWLLPLVYLLSLFNAVSENMGIRGLQLHVMYAVFFLIGLNMAQNNIYKKIMSVGLLSSGYTLVIYGFLNWFGNANYTEAVLENRLSNIFQYPNTYAGYLIAILICCLIAIDRARKWYYVALNSFMLFPIFMSLWLTLSRGGLVILPIVLFLYFITLHWKRQIINLVYLSITAISSLLLVSYMTGVRTQLNTGYDLAVSLRGWLTLILVSIIIMLMVCFLLRLENRFSNKKINKTFRLSNFYIPVCILILGVALVYLLMNNQQLQDKLPDTIQNRIENFNHENTSIASRESYIKDSMKIVKDYPIIGAGGGAWASLYNQYKSFPYISQQTHTIYLQYLVETGIVGTIVFGLFLTFVLFRFIRYLSSNSTEMNSEDLIFPAFSVAILIHSAIDFDMSFVYLSALVFLGIGVMASNTADDNISLTTRGKKNFAKVYSAATTIIAIILLFNNTQALKADTLYSEALHVALTAKNYNEIVEPLDQALKLYPNHPTYIGFKSNLLTQIYMQTRHDKYANEASLLLDEALADEPYNRQLFEQKYSLLIAQDNKSDALSWIEEGLEFFPWEVSLYERAINLSFEMGNISRLDDVNHDYWNQSLTYFEKFNEMKGKLDSFPKSEQAAMKITPELVLPIGQIYYMQGKYEKTSSLLAPIVITSFDESLRRITMRWYLASLAKQGESHESVYNTLIEKYPSEKSEIELLVNNF